MLSEPIFYELLVFAAGVGCTTVAAYLLARHLEGRRHREASSAAPLEARLERLEAALDETMALVHQLKTTQRFTVSMLENRHRTLGRPAAEQPRGETPH